MEFLKNQNTGYQVPFLHKTHTLPQILAVAEANLTSTVLQGLNIRSVEIICASCYRGSCVICKLFCELKKKETIEFCENVRSFEATLSIFFCFAFYRMLQLKCIRSQRLGSYKCTFILRKFVTESNVYYEDLGNDRN
jgi:hypothetical protein